jgi:hypothetical protein
MLMLITEALGRCNAFDKASLPKLIQVPIERRPGDPQRSADVPDRVPLISCEGVQLLNLLGSQLARWTTDPTTGSSGGQTGECPLPEEVSLELGQRSEHVEDELSAADRGVQLLPQRLEVDALLIEVPDRLDEVLEGPPQPV